MPCCGRCRSTIWMPASASRRWPRTCAVGRPTCWAAAAARHTWWPTMPSCARGPVPVAGRPPAAASPRSARTRNASWRPMPGTSSCTRGWISSPKQTTSYRRSSRRARASWCRCRPTGWWSMPPAHARWRSYRVTSTVPCAAAAGECGWAGGWCPVAAIWSKASSAPAWYRPTRSCWPTCWSNCLPITRCRPNANRPCSRCGPTSRACAVRCRASMR